MKAVDKYVIYDDANYIKGGWINRNNFQKLLKTLQTNYSKALYFRQPMELIEKVVLFPDRQLANFIAHRFFNITEYLDINTEFIISSQLPKDNSLKEKIKEFIFVNCFMQILISMQSEVRNYMIKMNHIKE